MLVSWPVCLLFGATRFLLIDYSYRLTASLIEILLHSDNVPHHRVLTLFTEHLTGFKITDAIELEAGEPPISPDLAAKIESYRPLTEKLHHILKEGLLDSQCNISFTDSWTDRSFNWSGINTFPN